MRIAIFTDAYFPFISGVVTHIQTLKEGLEAAGHEVLIVTVSPKVENHELKDGILYCPAIPLKKIYNYGIANPINFERLRYVKQFSPDVIHLHTEFSMGLFALFAAKRLKCPVVYTLHTMYDEYIYYVVPKRMDKMAHPVAHAYIRKIANDAAELIGPSKKVAEYFKLCGVNKRVNVIPNTVDLTRFMRGNIDENKIATVKKELDIADNDTALGFVGRLGKEKSLDVTIDYFSKAFRGEPQFKLFIIGTGPDKDELLQQITSLGMQKQIFMLGRIEHDVVPPYLQAFDLYTTASLTEMNSISLLEATASGLYAINRLDPNNLDQIVAGENGDTYTTPAEFEALVRKYAALSKKEKANLRAATTAYAMRYGRNEFALSILNVYIRALLGAGHKKRRFRIFR